MKLPAGITDKFGRPVLKLRKVSPQLMFGAGILGVVGAGILTVRSTLKLSDVLEPIEKELTVRQERADRNEEYMVGEFGKDLAKLKVRMVLDIAKLYAPAIGVGVLSIALLTGSHVTLNRRNAAGAAAYATLDQAYKRYRESVIEKYGREEDDHFRQGIVTVEETVTDDAGKTKKVKHARAAGFSEYAQLFCEGTSNWTPQHQNNVFFLSAQERYWNDRLQSRGHVFLNEIYDALGFERSAAGQVVGWLAGEDRRDGYISFGIFDNERSERVRDFMCGAEGDIWLDFNVDGIVYDKI
jgi:Family of unknown function (DUF6353)